MRIIDIRELAVPLQGNIANAMVNFAAHTVSLVAVQTDVIRNGRPLCGIGFDSIGRFAQSGLLRERILPRLRNAPMAALLDDDGRRFDPARVLALGLRDEKPGGHGDRACAMAAVELAFWDLNAKLDDEPAYVSIARHFGRAVDAEGVPVYAAGGYYYPDDHADAGLQRLRDEIARYRDLGYSRYKMKIGGAALATDLARVEAASSVAGDGQRLAVDANGRFDLDTALGYARALEPYSLRWIEEMGDPLDYELNRRITETYAGAVATGENLFAAAEVLNLLRYGGMRADLDIFQMDPGLCYGLTEYARIVQMLEAHGFDRRNAHPHGGHLINLHIAVGLGLGGCEAYPGVFQPFGGYPPECAVGADRVRPTDAPGFGLEQKTALRPALAKLLG
ncbi:MAG: mandelate racemase [Gammaproteobacteria bacterium]|nr:mandelate racemase [Gammaproteobacteria bacterium]